MAPESEEVCFLMELQEYLDVPLETTDQLAGLEPVVGELFSYSPEPSIFHRRWILRTAIRDVYTGYKTEFVRVAANGMQNVLKVALLNKEFIGILGAPKMMTSPNLLLVVAQVRTVSPEGKSQYAGVVFRDLVICQEEEEAADLEQTCLGNTLYTWYSPHSNNGQAEHTTNFIKNLFKAQEEH
jgi:hypothetical protein